MGKREWDRYNLWGMLAQVEDAESTAQAQLAEHEAHQRALAERRTARLFSPPVKVSPYSGVQTRGRPKGSKDRVDPATGKSMRRPRTVPAVVLGPDTAPKVFAYFPDTGLICRRWSKGADMLDCRRQMGRKDIRRTGKDGVKLGDTNWLVVRFKGAEYAAHDIAYWCMGLAAPQRPTFRNGDKWDTSWENIR